MQKQHAVLSLSGGMDSSSLLLHLLATGHNVTCLSFDYGQKHKLELECATNFVQLIKEQNPALAPHLRHQVIKLGGLGELLHSSLTTSGWETPEGHYESSNMSQTVVPNRNKIFSSIIQGVALSIAKQTGSKVKISMGIHAGDHAIYPDCRQEFRDADYEAFVIGNDNAEAVTYYTPFLEVKKKDILEDAIFNCDVLGLDWKKLFASTNTSYKPVTVAMQFEDEIVNEEVSDFMSASSVERIEAFLELGLQDPCTYAKYDENGRGVIVSWNEVVEHVKNVLKQNGNKD